VPVLLLSGGGQGGCSWEDTEATGVPGRYGDGLGFECCVSGPEALARMWHHRADAVWYENKPPVQDTLVMCLLFLQSRAETCGQGVRGDHEVSVP